jgi:hypothetical protein
LILEEIQQKLEKIDSKVFYGKVDEKEVGNEWNYIVFMRKKLSFDTQKNSFTDRFVVAVIRENFIPEGLENDIIDAMRTIPGVKVSGTDGDYNYVQKPNTNTVVEILTLEFVRARKRAGA